MKYAEYLNSYHTSVIDARIKEADRKELLKQQANQDFIKYQRTFVLQFNRHFFDTKEVRS